MPVPSAFGTRRSVVLLLCMSMLSLSRATADDTLEKIIENVRRNEALYENIDVTLSYDYDIGKRQPVAELHAESAQPPPLGTFTEASVSNYDLHYVGQDGLFRLERRGKATQNSRTQSLDCVRAFDGTTTRLFDQDAYGNVIRGRSIDPLFVHPHMMLMRIMNFTFPLSAFLSGDAAINAWPSSNLPTQTTVRSSYRGVEEYQGLHCHRVWTTVFFAGEPSGRWEFWLPENRNYVPVRILGYTFRWSQTIPMGEGTVTAFREVKPGVWFPAETKLVRYTSWVIQRTGKQELQWQEHYLTEKISLDPKYDLKYFQDVKFPDGIPVYEVSDGKIQSGHVVDAPLMRSPTARTRTGE